MASVPLAVHVADRGVLLGAANEGVAAVALLAVLSTGHGEALGLTSGDTAGRSDCVVANRDHCSAAEYAGGQVV